MKKNFAIVSDTLNLNKIPCVILKHRVLQTDPTYKFTVNADVYTQVNVPLKSNNETGLYYDLLEVLSTKNRILTGYQWLTFIEEKYSLTLPSGTNYFSDYFSELGFEVLSDKNLFDKIYLTIKDSAGSNDGIQMLLDFSLNVSEGFVRNKLNIDTNHLKKWILKNLSFNWLSFVMSKTSLDNFIVKEEYKSIFDLSTDEVFLLESLFRYKSDLMPIKQYSDNLSVNYFWDWLNIYSSSSINGKQHLFGFTLDKIQLTSIKNKDFSMDVSSDNLPMNINTKHSQFNNLIILAE